jgi:CheY-like chemotaxis protein
LCLYRSVPVTTSITRVMFLCAGLALDYAFDLSSFTLPEKLFWIKGRFFFLAAGGFDGESATGLARGLPGQGGDHSGCGRRKFAAAAMLTKLNYRVASVSGGEEAVEYLKARQEDPLILDMIMDPGIDGLEAYRRLLEFRPGQKAIIVSGFSETERVRQAQGLGGTYVRKPYALERITSAVRQELDR